MRPLIFLTTLLLVSPIYAEHNPSTTHVDETAASAPLLLLAQQSRSNPVERIRANPSDDRRAVETYPPCDEDFEDACEEAGGTMSDEQGWGGKTCFKPLGDDYCKGAIRRAPAFAAPGGGEQEGRVVGSCDSSTGCHSLQLACRDLPGHTYTPPGPGGVPKGKCTKDDAGATANRGLAASPPNDTPSGERSLASRGEGGLEDAVCTTTDLCNRLAIRCQGTFVRYNIDHGRCKDN